MNIRTHIVCNTYFSMKQGPLQNLIKDDDEDDNINNTDDNNTIFLRLAYDRLSPVTTRERRIVLLRRKRTFRQASPTYFALFQGLDFF
jgi:hypothetical protein